MNINLEEKLDILTEFAYNNDNRELTEKIHGNISLGDIKFSNKSEHIDELKKQSFNSLSLINVLPFSNTIVLGSKELPLTLFINPYKNKKDTKDKRNPFNLDSAISYLLSPLVINKLTPNLLLPLINFDIKVGDLPATILALAPFMSLQKKIKKKQYSNILSVRIRENYSKMKSLHTYLKNSSAKRKISLKPIIFQVLYTLAKLDENYKGFKHNSLDCYSIFVSNSTDTKQYSHNNKKYYIGLNNNFIKIGNFTSSYIPKMFKSSLTSDDKFKFMKNDGFDIHYFLNSLVYRDANLNNVSDKKEVVDFIKRIIPKKYLGNTKNKYYLNSDAKIPSINKILKDEFFSEYTIKSKEELNVSISTEQEKKLKKMIGLGDSVNSDEEESVNSAVNSAVSETNDSQQTTEESSDEMEGGYIEHNKRPIKNNPNISNDKRNTFKRRMEENPRKPKEPAVLVEQKIYNPQPPPKPSRPPPVLPFVPINQSGRPIVNYPYPYNNVVNKVPIQKIYNITIGDPSVTGNYIGEFFEDMIPSSPYPLNSLSLTDRIRLRGYVRNLLIEKMDGEEGSIVGGEKSLRKHFKWGPFNPYSLAKSPYDDIASNFCLYSVFYPFRYDHEKKVFNVAKDATSFNIRTYNLSVGSLYHDKLTEEMKFNNFNVFRELNYYKYILKQVINKKESPNFVNMIMYKTDKETKIKYDKLIDVKLRHLPKALRDLAYKPLDILSAYDEQIKNAKEFLRKLDTHLRNKRPKISNPPDIQGMVAKLNKRNLLDGIDKETDHYALEKYISDIFANPDLRDEAEQILTYAGLTKADIDLTQQIPGVNIEDRRKIRKRKLQELSKMLFVFGIKEKDLKLTEQSNRSLVVMTEGPTHNILRWTCPIYNQNGAQHTMIGTGYHPEEAWESVLFQLIHSLLVLVKHGIYFKELSLDKNIFIKDIFHNASNIGHWKYNVGNHSFYVPNHGFVVMFDSSYSDEIDIMNRNNTLDRATLNNFRNKRHYKIVSKNLFETVNPEEYLNETSTPVTFNDIKFEEKFKESIVEMLSGDNLRKSIELMKGIMPVEAIITKLNQICDDIKPNGKTLEKTLTTALTNNFSNYLHSRLGTALTKNEMNNVSLLPIRNFKEGSLVIYQERYEEYRWAVYVEEIIANNKHKIITKTDGSEKEVFLGSLRSYPSNMTVSHDFKKGYNYEEDGLLDTYTI